MIFILDLILFLNVFITYRSFKTILAPPVLMGGGMMLASFIATLYYNEWRMYQMAFKSMFILSLGVSSFSMFCFWFKKKYKIYHKDGNMLVSLSPYNLKRIKTVWFVLVIMGGATCYLKYRYAVDFYGNLSNFTELVGQTRASAFNVDSLFEYPMYVKLLSHIGRQASFFTYLLLSIYVLSGYKDKTLYCLLISQLVLIALEGGLLAGNKAAILDPILKFGIVYLFVLITRRRTTKLSMKIYFLSFLVFLLVVSTIKVLSSYIGRTVDQFSAGELFAIYIGAEVRNFDIYIQGGDKNASNKYWGEQTFFKLQREIDSRKERPDFEFQSVGGHSLGNVYTQFYHFHKDFGIIGVVVMMLVISLITMPVYNKAFRSVNMPAQPNLFVFFYTFMAIPLFMSFFSSRFTEDIIKFGVIRNLIFLYFYIVLFNKFLVNKNGFLIK